MRACTLLGDDVLIDLSPDIHAQKLRFGLRLIVSCIVFTHSHPDHQDIYALQKPRHAVLRASPGVPEEENVLDLYGNLWVKSASFRPAPVRNGRGKSASAFTR